MILSFSCFPIACSSMVLKSSSVILSSSSSSVASSSKPASPLVEDGCVPKKLRYAKSLFLACASSSSLEKRVSSSALALDSDASRVLRGGTADVGSRRSINGCAASMTCAGQSRIAGRVSGEQFLLFQFQLEKFQARGGRLGTTPEFSQRPTMP